MIYVACPPAFATGGTELLHQLAAEMRRLGASAMMYYPDGGADDPVAPRFKQYDVPYVRTLADSSAKDVLVVPEVMTQFLRENQKMRRYIWWLSVDNYFVSIKTDRFSTKVKRWLKIDNVYVPGMKGVGHLAQSYYAIDFLKRKGVPGVYYLSDYLSTAFMDAAVNCVLHEKRDRVLYNPKKGMEFTRRIMEAAPDVDFVAIENMVPAQIAELMQTSKIYIDFGNHPGKDRIPREAAICGCCVITGLDGAAKFDQDLPIPQEFKVAKRDANIPLIVDQIKKCFADYESVRGQFLEYRKFIRSEPELFTEHVKGFLTALG